MLKIPFMKQNLSGLLKFIVSMKRGPIACGLIAILALLPLVSANRGLIPWPSITLEESAQKAIIAWNGSEEVLILSTDVRGAENALVLEFLPLPSNPTKIEEGDFKSFTTLVSIVNKKIKAAYPSREALGTRGGRPGVVITFHARLGPHEVTVVEVNDLPDFLEWVENFTQAKALPPQVIPKDFRDSVEDYLQRGLNYFVFDVITVTPSPKSITPLLYRFPTEFLYYPLAITGNSVGLKQAPNEIQLFILTKGRLDETPIVETGLVPGVGFDEWIELTPEELNQVSPEVADLFKSDPFVVSVGYHGVLSDLKSDLVIPPQGIRVPSTLERFSHAVSGYLDLNYLLIHVSQVVDGIRRSPALWVIFVPYLGILACGIPTTAALIARLTRRFRARLRYLLGASVAVALVLLSNILVLAVVVLFTFFVMGLAGAAYLVQVILRQLSKRAR